MVTVKSELLEESFASKTETIKPDKNGVYKVCDIIVGNDYVAIAPLAMKNESSIIMPDEESTIGIIVGLGLLIPEELSKVFKVGSVIKFSPLQPICTLTGFYSFYGNNKIILTRYQNLLTLMSGYKVLVNNGLDK
jgi:hypothetical protein